MRSQANTTISEDVGDGMYNFVKSTDEGRVASIGRHRNKLIRVSNSKDKTLHAICSRNAIIPSTNSHLHSSNHIHSPPRKQRSKDISALVAYTRVLPPLASRHIAMPAVGTTTPSPGLEKSSRRESVRFLSKIRLRGYKPARGSRSTYHSYRPSLQDDGGCAESDQHTPRDGNRDREG